ncbi:hypothetical protein CHS0354_014867 [Potamilus streckersoni]|uniref:Uncharacterized protein n=1 Tax=Potamilus streckersoni TaxID=2493646 RepID=A0AAE0RMS7_9BIVA|nr:hypothetical protein CHS0354_014867 [Potamilus streckersoni]
MHYPCIRCTKEVTTRQQAVECDCCHRWQHRTCGTGISLKVYKEALKLGRLQSMRSTRKRKKVRDSR